MELSPKNSSEPSLAKKLRHHGAQLEVYADKSQNDKWREQHASFKQQVPRTFQIEKRSR